MKRDAPLVILLSFLVTGCPDKGPGPSVPVADLGSAATVGTGTLDLLVTDEHDRPLEGAVAWAPGTRLLTPVPQEPVVIEQEGLEFRPRFQVARRGQTLEFKNSDPELHNVHSSDACCSFNATVPVGGSTRHVLEEAGDALFLCNIHSHMRCRLLILDSLHGITDAKGHVKLDLPLGPRKLRVQAQDRERVDLDVTIAAVTTARVSLPLPPPGPEVVPPEKLPWPALAVRTGDALDEAVRLARLGRAGDARAAAEEAEGEWFSGSGFFEALREFDAAQEVHQGRAGQMKSDLGKFASRAENAANGDDEARAQLARQVEKMKNMLLDIARELPKR